jgi:pSer/pThr/pTyr-binding forkhead associated (FHA) protein
MVPKLVAVYGPLSDGTIFLDAPVVSIGRDPSNDVVLEDPFVSRRHCLIKSLGGRYVIEDLNSSNGTYVNTERVRERVLRDAALIQLGFSRFLFWLLSPDELVASRREAGLPACPRNASGDRPG